LLQHIAQGMVQQPVALDHDDRDDGLGRVAGVCLSANKRRPASHGDSFVHGVAYLPHTILSVDSCRGRTWPRHPSLSFTQLRNLGAPFTLTVGCVT
jgi:hypothetical protein